MTTICVLADIALIITGIYYLVIVMLLSFVGSYFAFKAAARKEGAETSTGIDENIAGMLCYSVGVIASLVFIIFEKKNKFVRAHALQWLVVYTGFALIMSIAWNSGDVAIIIVGLVSVVAQITGMIWAYQGKSAAANFTRSASK